MRSVNHESFIFGSDFVIFSQREWIQIQLWSFYCLLNAPSTFMIIDNNQQHGFLLWRGFYSFLKKLQYRLFIHCAIHYTFFLLFIVYFYCLFLLFIFIFVFVFVFVLILGEIPSPASLAAYRKLFGRDHYGFWYGGMRCLIINSPLLIHPEVKQAVFCWCFSERADLWLN